MSHVWYWSRINDCWHSICVLMRILLTGGRSDITLSLSRQLYHFGAKVFVADSLPYNLTALSTSIWRSFVIPPAKQEPMRFAYALLDIIRHEAIDLIIPTCDEMYTILQYEKLLRPHVHIFAPSYRDALRTHSGLRFFEWTQELGLPMIAVHGFKDQKSLVEDITKHGRKKIYQSEWSAREYKITPTSSDWVSTSRCSPQVPWISQEYMTGDCWRSYTWMQNGDVRLHTQYRTTSSRSTSIAHTPNPQIEEWIQNFGERSQYTGQISVRFVEKDANFYALSCTSQINRGLHCFHGIDLLHALRTRQQISEASVSSLPLPLFRIHPRLRSSGQWKDWLAHVDFLRGNIYSWKDPIPGLGQFLSYGIIAYRAIRKGIPLYKAAVSDIEWSTER